MTHAQIAQPIDARLANLTDKELFRLCQKCGLNIRTFQKEFAGYLPEVEKRNLYKKYGCHTLYEFAAKLAGMCKDTVDDILNVHKKLEDKPSLQSLIRAQGWSKVKVVATIARPETEKFWAEKVETMSKETLKTFIKELRKEASEAQMHGQAGLFADLAEDSGALPDILEGSVMQPGNFPEDAKLRPGPSTPMETSQKTAITFKLDDETEVKLRIFKQKLEKKTGEPKDWNQTIKALLEIAEQQVVSHPEARAQMRRQKRAHMKKQAEAAIPQKPGPVTPAEASQKSAPKRYIPAHVKHLLHQKYQGRCGYPD